MIDSCSNFSLKEPNKKQKNIFILRHGERADHVQKKWYINCFDESGNYQRNDLNFRNTIPNRINSPSSYEKDAPITITGQSHAIQVGIEMKKKESIILAYASPALRCIETCSYILEGLGVRESVKINVEPSLFEWLEWYEKVPQFMTMDELMAAGHNVNKHYKQVLPVNRLKNMINETLEEFYKRSYNFMEAIKNTIPSKCCGSTLIVGHSATLEVCSRQLLGHDTPTEEVFEGVYSRVTYCQLKQLVNDDGKWSVLDLKNFTFTNAEPGRFPRLSGID